MNPLDFSGKTALIVGGSSGIGRGIARAYHDAGATTHIWGTRPALSNYDAPEELSGTSYAQVDVSQADQVNAAELPFQTLDILVLCQGTVMYERKEFEIDNFRHVVEVNMNSMMTCAQKFFPLLKQSMGTIITVSSTAAYHATRGNPAYNASKAGIVGLTKTLGQAWANKGIRVNGIAPGLVDTKLTKVTTEHPDRLAGALRSIPLGRLGEPEDMAGAAMFLASPLSAYITGQTIIVDGGLIL